MAVLMVVQSTLTVELAVGDAARETRKVDTPPRMEESEDDGEKVNPGFFATMEMEEVSVPRNPASRAARHTTRVCPSPIKVYLTSRWRVQSDAVNEKVGVSTRTTKVSSDVQVTVSVPMVLGDALRVSEDDSAAPTGLVTEAGRSEIAVASIDTSMRACSCDEPRYPPPAGGFTVHVMCERPVRRAETVIVRTVANEVVVNSRAPVSRATASEGSTEHPTVIFTGSTGAALSEIVNVVFARFGAKRIDVLERILGTLSDTIAWADSSKYPDAVGGFCTAQFTEDEPAVPVGIRVTRRVVAKSALVNT
eukprot:comp21860_c0_seq1/m.49456 comp21860_c0_seq1/g.49456  ORF comp21860_c0_seq1/g.49456 comp21860_c0_seq1/m.49456 type:complete len:307 (+) comp21860_c0_seq1:1060-1980(+)